MISVRRALVFSFAEQYAATIIMAVGSIAIARLITPRDIGIYSVAASAVILLQHFRDFGVPAYLIQQRDLDHARFQSALGVSLVVALGIALVLWIGAGWLAWFYREPGLARVVHVTVLSLLIIPFNSQALATLRRLMQFNIILRITLAGAVCHTVTAITLAEFGWGYMAMAWASVANNLGAGIVAFAYRPRHWRWGVSLAYWRPIASLGLYTVGANLLEDMSARSADLVIGRLVGLPAVGQFSRANGLAGLVNQALVAGAVPVALSAFGMRHREGGDLRAAYLAAAARLSVLCWPGFLFVALMAYPIVRIMFGPQWDAAVPVARILAVAAVFTSVKALHPPLFQSVGRTRSMFWVQIVIAPLQVLGFIVLARFGLPSVALGVAAIAAIELGLSQAVLDWLIELSFPAVLAALLPSVLVTVASLVIPLWVLAVYPPGPDRLWAPLIVGGLGLAAGWLIALLALRHPLGLELRPFLRRPAGQALSKAGTVR